MSTVMFVSIMLCSVLKKMPEIQKFLAHSESKGNTLSVWKLQRARADYLHSLLLSKEISRIEVRRDKEAKSHFHSNLDAMLL